MTLRQKKGDTTVYSDAREFSWVVGQSEGEGSVIDKDKEGCVATQWGVDVYL